MADRGIRTSPRRGGAGGSASGVVAYPNFTPNGPLVFFGGSILWEGQYEPIAKATWVSTTGLYSVIWAEPGYSPTNVGYLEFRHMCPQMVTPARARRSITSPIKK